MFFIHQKGFALKITFIGTGYVGLVAAVCCAEKGNDVVCLDLDANKIKNLNEGKMPIYEAGLETMVLSNVRSGRLRFTTNVEEAVLHGKVQFIAVGTPSSDDGSADLQYVFAAAENIGKYMQVDTIVVNKSTVTVGTADKVRERIESVLLARGSPLRVHVVSNPEFLREGVAISDFMRPDRVIIGTDSDKVFAVMTEIYGAFVVKNDRILRMDARSAELTKYFANAMLALRISFMNQASGLAKAVGADIGQIRKGIGADPRIGDACLYAGIGWGGSCFPKDVDALIKIGSRHEIDLSIMQAVKEVNALQKQVIPKDVLRYFNGDIAGKTFAIWGLAFKPGTDDMRESPALVIIEQLINNGARVVAYDQAAAHEAEKIFKDKSAVSFANSAMDALRGADALILVTEWNQFRSPDWPLVMELMKKPVIFDGRNLWNPTVLREAGFTYSSIGRQ